MLLLYSAPRQPVRCIAREKSQPRSQPVHRSRPAHAQCRVQLSKTNLRTLCSTECFPRVGDSDAESRCFRDKVVRLRHM